MNLLEKRAAEEKAAEEKIIRQAYERTPEKYHDFIILLEQNKALFNKEVELTPKAREMGCFVCRGKTYIRQKAPYMSVDGRLAWFSDSHRKEDGRYKFSISSNLEKICEIIAAQGKMPRDYPLVVTIDSELYGLLEGESMIFWNGSGANSTNPIENAKTSALGRAIAQAGIGLIGTGIASAEEVIAAQKAAEVNGENDTPKNNSAKEAMFTVKILKDPKKTGGKKPYLISDGVTGEGEAVKVATSPSVEYAGGDTLTGMGVKNQDKIYFTQVTVKKSEKAEPPAEESSGGVKTFEVSANSESRAIKVENDEIVVFAAVDSNGRQGYAGFSKKEIEGFDTVKPGERFKITAVEEQGEKGIKWCVSGIERVN